MSTNSRGPSVAHFRAATPDTPLQPDHFYGNESIQLPPSPNSNGRDWLDPADDPTAQRGIPVFRPTFEEFQDFEGYMNRVEPWGMRSGIVKIIPPKEWLVLHFLLFCCIDPVRSTLPCAHAGPNTFLPSCHNWTRSS